MGYFGKHYARLLQDIPGAELVAVASRSFSREKGASLNIPYSVVKFNNAHDLISDPNIDAIIIASPATTHFEFIIAALKAGKHILVEKPMTMNLDEAKKVADLAGSSGKISMVGHQYLYNDYLRLLKANLDANKLGEIKYLISEHFYFGPIRSDIGCFWESASHELSIIDYLFNSPEISEIKASSGGFSKARDDFATAQIAYASGLQATIIISWFAPEKIRRLMIGGSGGVASFDDRAETDKLRFYPEDYPADAFAGNSSYFFNMNREKWEISSVSPGEPLRNQLLHFIDCIRSVKRPLTDFAHGLRVIESMDKIQSKF